MRVVAAKIWRHDGVINYVITPETLVHTFMAVVTPHDKWICQLVNDFGYAITPELYEKVIHPEAGILAAQMKQGLAKHHDMAELQPGRCLTGDPTMFDGLFYGTMHPTELAVLADGIEEAIEIVKELSRLTEEEQESTFQHVRMWVEAAKKFVRPSERMGSILGEIGTA